ncbi:MAG: phosphatase PAP2 family protein [Sinobacteraceae bacterium]|nr:phosphatase PAP2 family protein [Nevskiaceae bacterium]
MQPQLRQWRRPAAFAFLALVLSTGIVGGLKAVTNVDCPWDLAGFGGNRPYIGLFADRPDVLPHAQCFPGAHAASGFALLFGYFLFRNSSRRRARWALAAGLLTGFTFSLGQQARGAHFLSHDLTSAAIVWYVQLLLYRLMLAPRVAAEISDSAVRYPATPNQNPSPDSGSSSSTGPGAGREHSTEARAALRPREDAAATRTLLDPPRSDRGLGLLPGLRRHGVGAHSDAPERELAQHAVRDATSAGHSG